MSNYLIAYYTRSGNTAKVAGMIQKKTQGTLFEIVPQTPYPQGYNEVVDQAKKEIQSGYRPAIDSPGNEDQYDVIFVGTPNWWSTMAPPVASFLESIDVTGKTVVPFYTHGGGGAGHIEKDLKALCKGADVKPGLCIYGGSCSQEDLEEWFETIGL